MAKRLVLGAGHPEGVEERGELTGHGHHGAFLSVLASAFGEAESPTSEIAIGPEGSEDILGAAHEQATEHGVTAFGDAELGRSRPGVVLAGSYSQVSPDTSAVLEASGIFQREQVAEGGDRPDAGHLAEALGLGVALAARAPSWRSAARIC